MKYLCLVYGDKVASRSCKKNGRDRDYAMFLRESGHLLFDEDMTPGESVAVVQLHNERVSVKDGRNTQTLQACYLIRARDLNDAIQIVARIPAVRRGRAEVWPVQGNTKGV